MSSTGSLDLASLVRGDTFSHRLEKTVWSHAERTLNTDSNKSVQIVFNSRQNLTSFSKNSLGWLIEFLH